MQMRLRFEELSRSIQAEASHTFALGQSPSIRAVHDSLVFEEIHASTRLAGSRLSAAELRALLERGRALGEHRFADYLLCTDYASAARFVAAQEPARARRSRPYLRLEELLELHVRTTRGAPDAHPGTWRTVTLAATQSGIVAPPPWKIAAEMRVFIDRIVLGPPAQTPPLLWVAGALERFTRLQPFGSANGRVGRLTTNLLLRRLDLPPFVAPRASATYFDALQSAQAGDPWALALVIAKSVGAGLARLLEAGNENALELLADIAPAPERAALYKAAQRGRLRSVRRGAHLYTTRAWLDAYTTSRSSAGRRGGARKASAMP
jgi:Fic family protein